MSYYGARGGIPMGRGMRGRGGSNPGPIGQGRDFGGNEWSSGGSPSMHQDNMYGGGGGMMPGRNVARGRGAPPSNRDRSRSPVRGVPPPVQDERRYQHNQTHLPVNEPHPPAQAAKPPNRIANDCEIIVVGKGQQAYAEMIETALKEYGLKVDLMFPKADVRLAAFIESIATLGTIFAVVIRPDNESRGSVSVHVLRGPPKPEEHRNMPLASAYQLIKERYYELKRKEVGIIPDNIKTILKYLQDDRSLTDNEYKTVITFLQDRRKKQFAFENRNSNAEMNDADLQDSKGIEDLQGRILAVMNGKGGDKQAGRNSDIVPDLDKNPVVQQALNDLIASGVMSNVRNPSNMSGGRPWSTTGGGGGSSW